MARDHSGPRCSARVDRPGAHLRVGSQGVRVGGRVAAFVGLIDAELEVSVPGPNSRLRAPMREVRRQATRRSSVYAEDLVEGCARAQRGGRELVVRTVVAADVDGFALDGVEFGD